MTGLSRGRPHPGCSPRGDAGQALQALDASEQKWGQQLPPGAHIWHPCVRITLQLSDAVPQWLSGPAPAIERRMAEGGRNRSWGVATSTLESYRRPLVCEGFELALRSGEKPYLKLIPCPIGSFYVAVDESADVVTCNDIQWKLVARWASRRDLFRWRWLTCFTR